MRLALRIALLLSCVASPVTAAPAVYHFTVLNDGPSLDYLFQETTGPLVNYGSLGNAFNGTYNGTPLRGVATPGSDLGVSFDGTDDWIESLGSAPAQFSGNPTMSIETIVRIPTGATSLMWAPFLHWGTASPQTGRSAWFGLQNNTANQFFVGFYNSGLRTAPVPLGAWHHVVWVRNGSPNHSQQGSTLYVDGVAVPLSPDTDLLGALTPDVTSTTFRINRGHDLTRSFQGTMDELALFDFALTPVQVAAHYAASGLSAQVVPGLFNTGVDDAGQLLNNGAVDPHYTLVQSSDPSFPGPNALVPLSTDGFWYGLTVGSRWIAPAADESFAGAPAHPGGPYTYRLLIDLSGFDPLSAHISGSWGADNGGQIKLNGQPTTNLCNSASSLTSFDLTSGFGPGVNTIDFVVTNDAGGGANPTGLRVDGIAGTAGPALVGVVPTGATALALAAPAPNPASSSARLGYTLVHAGRVRLSIRNVAGRTVRNLLDRDAPAGPGLATWDGTTDRATIAPPGVYFVVLECEGQTVSRRLVWLR
jgi:hypothetical protein